MAELFGKKAAKEWILKNVGDISQICGVRLTELKEGRSKGVQTAQFWTGSGLEFEVLVSRGMGIGAFRYKGIPLAWMSPTGAVAPEYYEPEGGAMDRSYVGGLFHNGGLRSVGFPSEDAGESLGLHGKIANLPADNVCTDGYWDGDDYYVFVSGRVREVSALGENMVLRRTIRAKMGSNEIVIEDTVENASPVPSPHMILYHTNYGFPLIQEGTKMTIPASRTIDPVSGEEIPGGPVSVCAGVSPDAEQVLHVHDMKEKDGWSGYVIANKKLGLGVRVKYEKKNLNRLIQWMDEQDGRNVVEVGPSNCSCMGRAAERAAGTLVILQPYETRDYRVSFKVLDGAEQIEKEERYYSGM